MYSDDLGNDLLESSSSDDSDCECKFQNAGSINQIINNLSDLEFQHFFRVSRKTFQEIVGKTMCILFKDFFIYLYHLF